MIKKTVLNNGIRVISEFMPDSLSVSLGVWVDHGSSSETTDNNGISHFIEHLLFKGTPTRSALQIAHEIDSVGGVLNAFTSREYVCYYVKVLHNHFYRGLALLADIFQHPLFLADEIEKERQVILQEIRMQEDSPDDRIHDLFNQTIWDGHPLGAPIIGFSKNIEKYTKDQIASYWHKGYLSGNVILTAAGRVNHDELVESAENFFKDLSEGRFEGVKVDFQKSGARTRIFEKELEQEHLCLGMPALSQSDPDRYAALLMNTILGGSMSSRLFQEIREKRGLAYSIYSYLSPHSEAGSFAVYSGTSAENSQETFSLIMKELERLSSEPVEEDELASAKEQLKGNILLSLESSDNRMAKLAKNEIYHGYYLPLSEIEQGLSVVTAEKLLEVSSVILDPQKLNTVLLGPYTSADSFF